MCLNEWCGEGEDVDAGGAVLKEQARGLLEGRA